MFRGNLAESQCSVQRAAEAALPPERPATLSRVVVVVLNWNGWRDTIECLDSLLRSEQQPDQIVVVDNGSTDDSLVRMNDWAREIPHATPIVFIALHTNVGYAGGNNAGIRYAIDRHGCDFVWLLNNDVIVDPLALGANLRAALDDPKVAIVGSKILKYDDPKRIQALGGGTFVPPIARDTQHGAGGDSQLTIGTPLPLDHVVGASLFVRAEAIASIGLMDESYFLYREETDWCIRMRQAGWQLSFSVSATIWHKQGRSVGYKTPVHDYYAVRNMLRLLRKFHPVALPSAAVVLFARSVAPKVARGQSKRLAAVMRAFADFFLGKSGRAHTEAELLANRDSCGR